jgi:hypothetical protein
MTGMGRFWSGFRKGYRTEATPNAEKPRKPWFETVVGLIGIVAARASIPAYRIGGWRYLVATIGLAVAAVAAIWCLWMLWLVLFRPLVLFVADEGIVGCGRRVRDKVFTPIMYGRKGK